MQGLSLWPRKQRRSIVSGVTSHEVPSQFDLMWPAVTALRALGGRAHKRQIVEKVAEQENFTEAQKSMRHKPSKPQTALDYRLGWSYTRLKNIGVLVNKSRGIWELTERGHTLTETQLEREKPNSNYRQGTP